MIDPTTRHPWVTAALAATMQACYGPRFVLGLGRGDNGYFRGTGIEMATFDQMYDYLDIYRKLWAGETVTYDGPCGTYPAMSFAETYHGPAPEVWFAGYCQPKGARFVAEKCEGVLLVPMMTPEAVGEAVARIHAECERIDRDPASVKISALVVTAPDMDDFETRAIAHGRAVTYLQYKGYGETLCRVNHWDPKVCDDIRNHKQFAGLERGRGPGVPAPPDDGRRGRRPRRVHARLFRVRNRRGVRGLAAEVHRRRRDRDRDLRLDPRPERRPARRLARSLTVELAALTM